MEDELAKHTKKIYRTVRSKHSVSEKLKDITVEIFIIVFAVTLSIWLHGWSEQRHEHAEVQEFLRGLKVDLGNDIVQLKENEQTAILIDSNFTFLTSLRNKELASKYDDKEIGHHLYYSIRVSRPNIGRYDGFKSSGKIGNIENDSLKQHILVYYQQTMSDLADGEGFTNTIQTKVMNLQVERNDDVSNKKFVSEKQLQSWFEFGKQNFAGNIIHYNIAIKQAEKIIKEIDKEQTE